MIIPKEIGIRDYECKAVYDPEMVGGVAIGGYDVIISHHDVHGKDLKYYANQFKKWASSNTKMEKKITVVGVQTYEFDEAYNYVIFVKDEECYLIIFETNDKNVKDLIINSFEFK